MRSFKTLVAGALFALALSGCASTLNAVAGPPSAAEATTVAAAEVAFTQAAKAETLWLKSGKATPAQAKVAKAFREAAYADIVAGREAIANNDSAAAAVAVKLFNQALPAFSGTFATSSGGQP